MRPGTPCKELSGELLRETEKAIQFRFEDDNGNIRTEWFPLSQVDEIHHEEPARIIVSNWIYNTKEETWNQ